MRWKDVNITPDVRTLRQFGVLSALLCAGMAIWQGLSLHRPVYGLLLGSAAILFSLAAMVRPSLLRGIFIASIVVTFPIGWIISNLIILLLYFGMITPLAIAFRWLGRDLLDLKPPAAGSSTFWCPKPIDRDKRSYFKQF